MPKPLTSTLAPSTGPAASKHAMILATAQDGDRRSLADRVGHWQNAGSSGSEAWVAS